MLLLSKLLVLSIVHLLSPGHVAFQLFLCTVARVLFYINKLSYPRGSYVVPSRRVKGSREGTNMCRCSRDVVALWWMLNERVFGMCCHLCWQGSEAKRHPVDHDDHNDDDDDDSHPHPICAFVLLSFDLSTGRIQLSRRRSELL